MQYCIKMITRKSNELLGETLFIHRLRLNFAIGNTSIPGELR